MDSNADVVSNAVVVSSATVDSTENVKDEGFDYSIRYAVGIIQPADDAPKLDWDEYDNECEKLNSSIHVRFKYLIGKSESEIENIYGKDVLQQYREWKAKQPV